MASANLDLVRSIYAGCEQGDFSSVDWAHPDIEYGHADGLAAGSWTGLAGMTKAFLDFINAWEDWSVEAEAFRELDAQCVLVLFRFSGRGKASGLEVGQVRTEGANLFHFSAGKVTRLVQYLDRERAVADLGLAPKTGARDP
jgi:ketosteroid isomerase-like protein